LGPKDEVLAKALARPALVPRPLKIVTEPGG
jgi:hypothetical protein